MISAVPHNTLRSDFQFNVFSVAEVNHIRVTFYSYFAKNRRIWVMAEILTQIDTRNSSIEEFLMNTI